MNFPAEETRGERTRYGAIIRKVRMMIYAKTWRKTRVRFKMGEMSRKGEKVDEL